MYSSTSEGLTALKRASARGLAVFAPPPDLTVSAWADAYRRLPKESSAEPGQWMTARAEYQRGPMDALNDPLVETIVLMWCAQVGKSEILLNACGYFIDQDPSPILFLQPTLEMAEAFSKDRLAPTIRDTPQLTGKFGDPRSRDSGNTLLHKTFPGGHITLAGANSPASLASRPIRIVICDEVDRYPQSAGTEGDPVNLATKRSTTFWNRKRILTSTPTIKGASRIEFAFDASDQRRFFVPCPQCGEYQVLTWGNLKWSKDGDKHDPESCFYVCAQNGCVIADADKPEMIRSGHWRATNPGGGDGKTAGFHLNELYSPWVPWPVLISNFLEAKKKPDTFKTWVNTTLGESWEEQGEKVDDGSLLARREVYEAEVPAGAVVLTAGVDVQGDRIEFEVVGWGLDDESWSIDYGVLRGNPALPEIWSELDLKLQRRYRHESGVDLRIACTLVDSGGHHTKQVYSFCKPRYARRIFACKGVGGAGKPLAGRASTANRQKISLFPVGTDTAKELLFARLKVETIGPSYCHFPAGYKREDATVVDRTEWDAEYFAQLTAEKLVTQYKQNVAKKVWVKTRARNEALDLRVYAMAALDVLRPNLPAIVANLEMQAERIKPAKDPDDDNPTPPPAPKPPTFPARPRPRGSIGGWVNAWKV